VAFAVKLSLIHETKMNQKIIRAALALLFISLLITAPRAQQTATTTQRPEDRVALYQALLDLTNPWTVMCVAAHPDDEDGTSLIVMRRKYGAHTVSLFSTFGEGGQNAIGPELYEELGAIRARETMAAAEIQGSEPYFLGLKDYGFSKTADEAFKIWGHEEALRRMVLQIRKLRPDIIITNHSVTNNDHGQHQATARLTVEAFDAAADPKRFPEQLKDGVTVWQVQRLFVRAGRSSNPAPGETRPMVIIDPNERDPIRETVYAEEALRGLQKHATQGPWPKTFAEFAARFRSFTGQSAAPGQLPLTRYVLVREAKGAESLTKDSHNFLDGLRLPEENVVSFQPPTIAGQSLTNFLDDRDKVERALISANKTSAYGRPQTVAASDRLAADPRLVALHSRLNTALAITLRISAQLISSESALVPGGTTRFQFRVSNQSTKAAIARRFWFGERYGKTTPGVLIGPELPPNLLAGKTIEIPLSYETPSEAKVTVPHSQHLYDGDVSGRQLEAAITIDLGETDFPLIVDSAIDVAPPIEIESIDPSLAVVTPESASHPLNFAVSTINHVNKPFNGILSAQEQKLSINLPPDAAQKIQFRLPKGLLGKTSELQFTIKGSSSVSSTVPIVFSNARVAPNLRVGYVRGFDFSLPNALNALGVESKELSVDEVKTSDLQKYSSIIVDNRVYESTPGLIETNQKLLDYAKAGGTLIVFYHKSFEWNPDERRHRPQLAPYKLILGDERIVDENAPITFLEPEHQLLNFPNKMGQEDFANWIQERGLYYPKEWDPQFHALLQSNDPGEAPLKGGLLVADYGRGHYIYSSMVWYRELRAGVPGAYRMLANMISYGAK
jgi:LmbE family N-acetylglucosaminyl deacetylase